MGDGYYVDESLYLLAFDLMCCCRTYGYYKGLVAPVSGKTIKKPISAAPTAEELAQKEQERLDKIALLEQEIVNLERSCDGCKIFRLSAYRLRQINMALEPLNLRTLTRFLFSLSK